MENEYISKLNKYLLEEDILSVSREVSALKIEFDDWLLHSEGQQQVAVIKAKELGEEIEEIDYAVIKESFYASFLKYKEAKKQQVDVKNKLEAENLKLKTSLISDLKILLKMRKISEPLLMASIRFKILGKKSEIFPEVKEIVFKKSIHV